jgi:hypothetical protein
VAPITRWGHSNDAELVLALADVLGLGRGARRESLAVEAARKLDQVPTGPNHLHQPTRAS